MAIYDKAIEIIRTKSVGQSQESRHEITINFHPDRYTDGGLPLLIAIQQDQRLKSQFETNTSNGGLTALSGGDRWKWESRAFDGIYDNCEPMERPKYGALNYMQFGTGASPRFGSSFFRLKPHMLSRSTFCYPDSVFEPDNFATSDSLTILIELATMDKSDSLDSYIEAHIHGVIDLTDDIEALVLDPAFLGTEVERHAQQLPFDIQWHEGYELETSIIAHHANYRSQEIVELAQKIAINDKISPRILGNAVNRLGYDQQETKKIWHYLARFGYKSKSDC